MVTGARPPRGRNPDQDSGRGTGVLSAPVPLPAPGEVFSVSKTASILVILSLLLVQVTCRPTARSRQSYDQIRSLVTGKTAAQVERLLGEPDIRNMVLDDSRWVWWNYTFLDGDYYAPEIRGRIVHLEITFRNPRGAGSPVPLTEWRVQGPLSVSYSMVSPSP